MFTGLVDNQYSWLYSPQYIMGLRLTGQLILLRVLEEAFLQGHRCIMMNTDGASFLVDRDKVEDFKHKIDNLGGEFRGLIFEYEKYKSMFFYNVNSYYAFTESGAIKTKGEATSETILDGSNEFNIIALAVQNYLHKRIKPEETILNHSKLFDFTTAKKVDKKYKVFYKGNQVQQLNRYFVSKEGAYLYKSKDKEKMEALMKGIPIYICNEDIRNVDIKTYSIDYQWYVNKSYEKIELFEPKQLSLFDEA